MKRHAHPDQADMWNKIFPFEPLPDWLISPIGGMWYSQGREIKKRPPEFYEKVMQVSLDDPPYDGMSEERPLLFSGIHEGLLPVLYGGFNYDEWCQILQDDIDSIPFPKGSEIPRPCL